MSKAPRASLIVGLITVFLPGMAFGGKAFSGRLQPDFCHVRDFSGGGTFNGAVTHNHKFNDIFQILCEPGGATCWAWSFNTGNGGTVLAAGLTDLSWEWWICAWDTNGGRTKYQAIASMPGADFEIFSDEASARIGQRTARAPAKARKKLRLLRPKQLDQGPESQHPRD